MVRIINGIKYDTETSNLLYFDEAKGRSYYATSHSRYFITFANGEMQETTIEAMKALLGKYDPDKYVEVFGEPTEG